MEAVRRSRQTQRRMQRARPLPRRLGPKGKRPSTLLRAQGRLMASGTFGPTHTVIVLWCYGSLGIAAHNMLWLLWLLWGPCYGLL